MGLQERISRAQISSDLGERANEIADIDIVRVTGMVGAIQPLGVALWRCKYSGALRELPTIIDTLNGMLLGAGKADNESEATQITHRVVMHFLDDHCDDCDGTGYERIAGTPALSDVQCPTCHGQGRLPLSGETEAEKWLRGRINDYEAHAAGEIMRRLREAMEW